jgi:hypothetical protein
VKTIESIRKSPEERENAAAVAHLGDETRVLIDNAKSLIEKSIGRTCAASQRIPLGEQSLAKSGAIVFREDPRFGKDER